MSNPKTIIRFDQSDVQTSDHISRTIGFVEGKFLLPLFQRSILDANPRRPKRNKVTDDIIRSLDKSSEIFQFKSKGILIGTSSIERLQRSRINLRFEFPKSEGILDGGHNMLSIGLFILRDYMEEKAWTKIRDWDDLIDTWELFDDQISDDRSNFNFLVSVELITPSSDDPDVIDAFKAASIDICAARNNNSALAQTAKANQKGFYDEIKKRLEKKSPLMAARVEWKPNYIEADSKKPIKVRDLVAFSWLPLSVLAKNSIIKIDKSFSPKLIYSSKQRVSDMFDKLFEDTSIAEKMDNGKYILKNESVESAIEILCDLPELYDYLFLNMSKAADQTGGTYNLIKAVKGADTQTPFTLKKAKYRNPDGFIVPLFFGLTVLMEVKNDVINWKVDPLLFLKDQLVEIMSGYKLAIEGGEKDPQKVAKQDLSYNLAMQQFKFSLQNYLTERGG